MAQVVRYPGYVTPEQGKDVARLQAVAAAAVDRDDGMAAALAYPDGRTGKAGIGLITAQPEFLVEIGVGRGCTDFEGTKQFLRSRRGEEIAARAAAVDKQRVKADPFHMPA